MSIFDSISDSISSLYNGDVSGAADALTNSSASDWFNVARTGVKAYGSQLDANAKQQTQEDYLYKFLERNTSMQSTTGNFVNAPDAKVNQKWGAGNYSVDPQDIQREWAAYLQGISDPSAVPGKLYKASGAN